jgi:hypothetical protein
MTTATKAAPALERLDAAAAERDAAESHAAAVAARQAPEATGPRMPRLLEWVAVPEYPGFQMQAWVNVPQRVVSQISADDSERALAALGQIVVAHNGWSDDAGEPFPPASDPAFWESLPMHLIVRIVRGIREAAAGSPLPTRNGRG